MSPTNKSVVITDLDNTLFDWVDLWYQCFSRMFDKIVEISEVDAATLKAEIKAVHQKHGTSEYAFLIEEIPSLQEEGSSPDDLLVKYKPAIDAYREARREYLRLYPGVIETLRQLKNHGCMIVAYTESMAFYTNYRIRNLSLDGVIDYLYSPEDHDLPRGLTPEQIRYYEDEKYQLRQTEHRYTPRGEKKPNPHVLLQIISDISASPSNCIYLGDSIWKDVAMAKDAGVECVHAKYGESIDCPEYELLKEVTHWTDEEVEFEREIRKRSVAPDFVAESCISQLLTMFRFAGDSYYLPAKERLDGLLEVWKKTVDVQQHFNDISMRVRTLFVTILSTLLGAIGISLWRDIQVEVVGITTNLGFILSLVMAIVIAAFYFVDRFWYHRLLIGSVKHGLELENRIRLLNVYCDLGGQIGKESPVKFLGYELHSNQKINIFYGVFVIALLAIWIAVWISPDQRSDRPSYKTSLISSQSPIQHSHREVGIRLPHNLASNSIVPLIRHMDWEMEWSQDVESS